MAPAGAIAFSTVKLNHLKDRFCHIYCALFPSSRPSLRTVIFVFLSKLGEAEVG
jgi:hypothetical protein